MKIEYQLHDDLSGMYGIQPSNQDSYELLNEVAPLPAHCWLGNVCYADGRTMQSIIDCLGLYEGVTINTEDGVFVSSNCY